MFVCFILINVSGFWVENVCCMIELELFGMVVDLVVGVYVELEGVFEYGVYYMEAPSDWRAVFAIPWQGRTLVGTTETPYEGDPAAVAPREEELEYLVSTFECYFVWYYVFLVVFYIFMDIMGYGCNSQALTFGDYLGDTQPGVMIYY